MHATSQDFLNFRICVLVITIHVTLILCLLSCFSVIIAIQIFQDLYWPIFFPGQPNFFDDDLLIIETPGSSETDSDSESDIDSQSTQSTATANDEEIEIIASDIEITSGEEESDNSDDSISYSYGMDV